MLICLPVSLGRISAGNKLVNRVLMMKRRLGLFYSAVICAVFSHAAMAADSTALRQALRSGNASNVTVDEILDSGIAYAQTLSNTCNTELSKIYPSGLAQTTFPVRSAYMSSVSSRNIPLHVANNSGKPNVYSWMGSKDSGTRYSFLGTDVFGFSTVNVNLKDSTLNLITWLLQKDTSTDILNEALVVVVPDYWDRQSLNAWFTANGISSKWTISSDASLLTSGAFDLFISSATSSNVATYTNQAFASNKPVLVFNSWYAPSDTLLALFDLTWDWYGSKTIGDMGSVANQCSQTSTAETIKATFTTFKNGVPDFIYNSSNCPNNIGTVSCDLTAVTDALGNTAASLLTNGMASVRKQVNALDKTNKSAFSLATSEKLIKLAVLLGDKYRANIVYPMDKTASDDNAFYQALFADNAVNYSRANNVYQPDLGDFTNDPVALRSATVKNKTLSFTPTGFSEWTSTGVYVPPGKKVTITRTDAGSNVVKVKLNILRESTRLWNTDKYSRPRYMTSPEITLEAGKTYTLSSPYGGPVYVYWDAVSSNPVPFALKFTGVLDTPLLKAFTDTAITKFLTTMLNSPSDWVDIKTPFAEIHSLKANMLTAFAKQDGDSTNGYTVADVKAYIKDLNHYLILGNYAYAGFTGSGLPALNAKVTSFCNTLGLSSVNYAGTTTNLCTDATIHAKPKIQHINSDVNAACGALCAGNPFDSGYPIMPLDWGENHEMGHNLQRARLKIYDGRSSEVSNNIFPLYTQWRWTVAQGLTKHPSQTRPANQAAFTILQTNIAAGTAASSSHPLWSGTGTYDNAFERLAFYMQIAYTQQSWDVYTKLYLMERIFTDALKTDEKWAAVKDLLGFGNYTRTDASAISSNDFMYIALSKIAGKNYSKYFTAWGIAVSDTALAQVTANGNTVQIPTKFFYVNNELPAAMPKWTDTILLNGTNAWADPTP